MNVNLFETLNLKSCYFLHFTHKDIKTMELKEFAHVQRATEQGACIQTSALAPESEMALLKRETGTKSWGESNVSHNCFNLCEWQGEIQTVPKALPYTAVWPWLGSPLSNFSFNTYKMLVHDH